MNEPAKIILIEDHTIVRNALKALIERLGDYQIVHQYSNGKEFVKDLPLSFCPDLIIMDLNMPLMDGKATMQWLKKNKFNLPVLILTLETADKIIVDLFRLGIRGYLPKHCDAMVLKKAIDDVITTGYHHNELLAKAIMEKDQDKEKSERDIILERLTDREKLFLKLVCDEEEYTYDKIAEKMKVHRRSVDGFRESIFEKFNIKSKTGLVLFAIKYDLHKVEVQSV